MNKKEKMTAFDSTSPPSDVVVIRLIHSMECVFFIFFCTCINEAKGDCCSFATSATPSSSCQIVLNSNSSILPSKQCGIYQQQLGSIGRYIPGDPKNTQIMGELGARLGPWMHDPGPCPCQWVCILQGTSSTVLFAIDVLALISCSSMLPSS